ncbi:MAG: hypothetical protein AB7K24_29865 [Gemmataceae bacterium]
MTREEWFNCADPAFMCEEVLHRASHRQLRLIGAACCRRIEHLCTGSLEWIELAERLAEGPLDLSEYPTRPFDAPHYRPEQRALAHLFGEPDGCFRALFFAADAPARASNGDLDDAIQKRERAAQCHLVRDILGYPRRSPRIDPDWLAWHDATVVQLARIAYEERSSTGHLDSLRLAILADALEEAGCNNEELLGHLRGPGPHLRGCWPLDLLLNTRAANAKQLL